MEARRPVRQSQAAAVRYLELSRQPGCDLRSPVGDSVADETLAA